MKLPNLFTIYKNMEENLEMNLQIDKLNTIYFDINIFEKCILSDNVKYMFNISYKKALEDLELKLNLNIRNLLLSLDKYDYKINNSFFRYYYVQKMNHLNNDDIDLVLSLYSVEFF